EPLKLWGVAYSVGVLSGMFTREFAVDDWNKLQEFRTSTISAIDDRAFQPCKYTNPRGYRRFTLLPVNSFQCRHALIEFRALGKLLVEANTKNSNAYPTASDAPGIDFDLFRMENACYQTLESLETENSIFW
ncbi:hypothetical protein DFQ29_008226, partial [Apophysomyces sp. BC1021]